MHKRDNDELFYCLDDRVLVINSEKIGVLWFGEYYKMYSFLFQKKLSWLERKSTIEK